MVLCGYRCRPASCGAGRSKSDSGTGSEARDMTTGGLSKTRLERLHRGLAGHVERGELPGLVALVSRGNDVHIETLGTMAVGRPAPMQRDTIFRIASMTKPVAAVA